jgi:phosphoribosylamine--glycine ligase
MGTSIFWADRNRLFEETLGRLESWLAGEGYVGSIDPNRIVDDSGIYHLEFTPRFGYPTIALQEEGFDSPTGQFFDDLADGRDPDLRVLRGFQAGVRVARPPFPFDDAETYDENFRNAVVVFQGPDGDGVHLEDTDSRRGGIQSRQPELSSGASKLLHGWFYTNYSCIEGLYSRR